MESAKAFYKIMDEICDERNIKQNVISYGWITELKKGDISKYEVQN